MKKIYIYRKLYYENHFDFDEVCVDEENIFLSLNSCFNYLFENEITFNDMNVIQCGLIDETGIKIIYYFMLDDLIIHRDKDCIYNRFKIDFETEIDITEDEQTINLLKMMI